MPADMPPNYFLSVPSISMAIQPSYLSIRCGAGGTVTVSLQDGKVTLTNCPVDEGAKAFWKAVERFAPVRKPD